MLAEGGVSTGGGVLAEGVGCRLGVECWLRGWGVDWEWGVG